MDESGTKLLLHIDKRETEGKLGLQFLALRIDHFISSIWLVIWSWNGPSVNAFQTKFIALEVNILGQYYPVLHTRVSWSFFLILTGQLWKINSLNFFNEESSLIAWFLFFEFLFISIFQLLKMIVDAEHDFDKTKESVCEKQGGLLKLNCRLLLTSFQPWII